MKKELGRIEKVIFGSGGYQGAQFGIWFSFNCNSSCCGDGRGVWQGPPSSSAKWNIEDKKREMGAIMLYIEEIMSQAKVGRVEDLKGKPVQCTFDDSGNRLESWRILTEVL